MNASLSGKMGEELAARYLEAKGYKIIGRNYRTRYGEIDLILEKSGVIVFAEVKLRKNARYAEAREFVDNRKRGRVRLCAELWLSENDCDLQARLDVVEIYAGEGRETQITHIKNAF